MESPISEQAAMLGICKRWWPRCPIPPEAEKMRMGALYTSLLVGPLPLEFVLPKHCCRCIVSVGGGDGIEYTHIKVSLLKFNTPDSIGGYIPSCTILAISRGTT